MGFLQSLYEVCCLILKNGKAYFYTTFLKKQFYLANRTITPHYDKANCRAAPNFLQQCTVNQLKTFRSMSSKP